MIDVAQAPQPGHPERTFRKGEQSAGVGQGKIQGWRRKGLVEARNGLPPAYPRIICWLPEPWPKEFWRR